MSENRIDAILEGAGGFTPPVLSDEQAEAAWNKHTGGRELEPEGDAPSALDPDDEPAPVRAAAPEAPKPVEADIALLRADGWSAEDIKALSPEAAARHALRVSGRSNAASAERTDEASKSDDLETLLTEEFSAKTAKRLAPLLRGITEKQAALSRGVREQTLDGLRERYVGSYPELARPEVQKAVLAVVGENPSRDQYERGLRVLYGARQAPDERREARAQVDGQIGFGGRGRAPRKDPEAADRAAWDHYQKTGDVAAAKAVRGRLN